MIHFDIENLKKQKLELEKITESADFWQKDSKETGKILSEIKQLKSKIDKYEKTQSEIENLEDLTQLVVMENDEQVVKEILTR